jgi:hypothetical protein
MSANGRHQGDGVWLNVKPLTGAASSEELVLFTWLGLLRYQVRPAGRTLDPQDGGLGVIAAQGVFFVRRSRAPTCGLFTVTHAVWSPDGPQESCRIVSG